MGQVPSRQKRSLTIWASVGIAAALLLICSGPVSAQRKSPKEPTTEDYVRHIDQQMKEAEAYDPRFGWIFSLFKSWVFLSVAAVVVVGAVIVLKFGGRLFVAAAGKTDYEKMAANDPWVRAQLERERAQGGDASGAR
jgi:hypothetical protein